MIPASTAGSRLSWKSRRCRMPTIPRSFASCGIPAASTSRMATPRPSGTRRVPSCRSFRPRRTATRSKRSRTTWSDAATNALRQARPTRLTSVRLRLATRGSTLAMIQAQLAADALSRRYPEHEFVLAPLTTHGDRHPSMRLSDSPREGVFVKELEQALLDGRAELAVHSAKDLPTLATRGLVLAAFLPRGDARVALITRVPATLSELAPGSRIGTGSPRRAAQIAAFRPDLQTDEVRGNVDSRLSRLADGLVDGLILAVAGLERLGRLGQAHELLPLDVMLPAPGQGALVLQTVEGSQAGRLAAAIDDAPTRRAVEAERTLLRRLGGGCLSALGAHALADGDTLALQAVVLDASGHTVIRAGARGPDDAGVVSDVASRLEAQGAARLLKRPGASLAGLRIMVTAAEP